jgi:hypothetical protein
VALALIDEYAMARRESATHIPTAGTPPGCVGEIISLDYYFAVGRDVMTERVSSSADPFMNPKISQSTSSSQDSGQQ